MKELMQNLSKLIAYFASHYDEPIPKNKRAKTSAQLEDIKIKMVQVKKDGCMSQLQYQKASAAIREAIKQFDYYPFDYYPVENKNNRIITNLGRCIGILTDDHTWLHYK